MKNLETAVMIQKVINYTNKRIEEWYKNALINYNVKGRGVAHYDKKENKVVVEYVEDGKQKKWEMAYYPEYVTENRIDWIFDCWRSLV